MAAGERTAGASPTVPGQGSTARPRRSRAAGSAATAGTGTLDWTAAELAEVHVALQAEVDRLRAELDVAEADLADLIADSGDGAGDDQADVGSKTFEREHEMSVTANTREMLDQALRAVRRLEDGTYGLCESCGQPIRKGRLRAFPRATLCIGCKQAEEHR